LYDKSSRPLLFPRSNRILPITNPITPAALSSPDTPSRPIIIAGASVIVLKGNSILLQLRADNGLWGLPGASMEFGEEMQEVAIRELFEETGLKAINTKLFDVFSGKELYYQYPNGDEVYLVIAVYICTEYEGTLNADNDEVLELQFFDIDGIPIKISPPDIPIIRKFLDL
jgi:8-oxo-dGTP pyrophosphatase MutT (NUDIX family)